MCHVSCVICQMSHVTFHMSHVTFYKVVKLVCRGSVINGVYLFYFFLVFFFKEKRVETQYLLILGFSGLVLCVLSSFGSALFHGKISLKKNLLFEKKVFKCIYCFPEVHRNCFCKTFLSTFMVLLLERACCLYVPLNFLLRQCREYDVTGSHHRPLASLCYATQPALSCIWVSTKKYFTFILTGFFKQILKMLAGLTS